MDSSSTRSPWPTGRCQGLWTKERKIPIIPVTRGLVINAPGCGCCLIVIGSPCSVSCCLGVNLNLLAVKLSKSWASTARRQDAKMVQDWLSKFEIDMFDFCLILLVLVHFWVKIIMRNQ